MKTEALVFSNTKEAAIYFDKIIPAHMSSLTEDRQTPIFDIVRELLPSNLVNEIFGIQELDL